MDNGANEKIQAKCREEYKHEINDNFTFQYLWNFHTRWFSIILSFVLIKLIMR